MLQDSFEFHVPVNVVKAGEGANQKMILGGIASTADTDREGENLMPEGFDYSYLLNHGFINWHHQMNKNPEAVIGEPTMAEVRKGQGLYIEGELYPESEMAKKAYALTAVLKANSKKRKMGWSIEGKVVERDPNNPKRVLKAKITGVALTPMPINQKTFANIIKGMTEDKELEGTADFTAEEAVQSSGNGGDTQELKVGKHTVGIKKGEDDELLISVKGLNTDSGRAVIPESVEGGTKPKSNPAPKREGEEVLMTKGEAYEYLFANYPDMTIEEAKSVVKHIESKK